MGRPFSSLGSGIAQALVDASGCRVILQSHIIDADQEGPDSENVVGYREVAVGDPLGYLKKIRFSCTLEVQRPGFSNTHLDDL